MEAECCVSRSIIDEFHPSDIQRDQMEAENSVTGSIIDEVASLDIQRYQMEGESVFLEVSLMNVTLWISNEIKWKLKLVLL